MQDRRRKQNPKRHQLCLRLTDHQLELLKEYASVREALTEVDAIRHMIDGLEGWLSKRSAKQAAAESGYSGPTKTPDPPDQTTDSQSAAIDETPSLGDFGGMPSVGLPGMHREDV